MEKTYTAVATVIINSPASKVWEALTRPELIKQYMFGVDVISDWRVGSPITYRGEWEGKSFEDKGRVLEVKPEKSLITTHWSPLSGVPDSPENYHTVSYQLSEKNGRTRVTISQDKNATEEEKEHSERNWTTILNGLKNLLEA
jgi:uncharacterized protein YndB with AHSA1/START domain